MPSVERDYPPLFSKRRRRRAWKDTGWFSIRTDVLPFVASFVVAYVLIRDEEKFQLTDLLLPFLAGIAMLVIAHSTSFVWNLARAGDYLALEDAHNEIDSLRAQVPTEPPPRIPPNRDALITAITQLERTVLAALRYGQMIEQLRLGDPDKTFELDRAQFQPPREAWRELELQERLAGREFAPYLEMYRREVGWAADEYLIAEYFGGEQPVGEKTYVSIRDEVQRKTKKILRELDAGELYRPALAALIAGEYEADDIEDAVTPTVPESEA